MSIRVYPDDRVFVLTGAGISAESGIPTFRDANGLWHGYRIEDVACPEAWERDSVLVWNFYSMRRKGAMGCKPNPAHYALAELERELGDNFFLCTQNIDNLHEQAGSTRLIHMHGELFKSRCVDCDKPFEDVELYETADKLPLCKCGARVRPHIVWFGEVPFEMDYILSELDRCTVLLVVGTSGVVQPAASFVHWVNQRYARGEQNIRTYYIGLEYPANSEAFTKVFCGKAGELMPKLFEVGS